MVSTKGRHSDNISNNDEKSRLIIEDSVDTRDDEYRTAHGFVKLTTRTRLTEDLAFRRTYIKSCCIFWAFIVLGWIAGQLGAALPDLQLIINTDLQTASLLITGGGIGLPIGALIAGPFYTRINTNALLATSLLGCAAMAAALPWCPTFAGMLTVCIVYGVFKGGLETAGNAVIAMMWGMEGRPYMQTLHFMFSAGGILSPFITGLFLVPKLEHHGSADVTNTTTDIVNISLNVSAKDAILNVTAEAIGYVTTTVDNRESDIDTLSVDDEIKVQYAYVITAALALSAAVPFIVMYFTDKNPDVWRYRSKDDSQNSSTEGHVRKVIRSHKLRRLCILLAALVLLFYAGVELTIVNFLTTFCLEYFDWTKSSSSIITSVFWLTFALGRFSGIFLIRCIKPGNLIYMFLVGMVVSTLGMLMICIARLDYLMWVLVSLVGYFSSTIWACQLSWLEENITPITGKIASMTVLAAMTGEMINPIFVGYMMENVSPLTFLYVPLTENVLCLLLFAINHVIVSRYAQVYSEIK